MGGDDRMSSSNKTYNVIDIAKYVINKSIEMEAPPISNLKLQKILYFIQGEFLSVLRKPAFLEEIQAWNMVLLFQKFIMNLINI